MYAELAIDKMQVHPCAMNAVLQSSTSTRAEEKDQLGDHERKVRGSTPAQTVVEMQEPQYKYASAEVAHPTCATSRSLHLIHSYPAMHLTTIICAFLFFACLASAGIIQGECADTDPALQWLSTQLSTNATISCRGSPLQLYNEGRYWGEQYGKNAIVAVFSYTKYDVSQAVRASALTPLGRDLSFVSGGHGQTNASSTTGFIIDLTFLNSTEIVHNITLDDTHVETAIAYEGGATWEQVYNVTDDTGYFLVGARDSSVGAGGFSTGGGIGFLAGAYGYAVDRIRAMEVVTMSGDIVLTTKTNEYSDLFWALQGGNGQFGIVTKFWQEAIPEPTDTEVGIYIIANSSLDRAYENVAEWFEQNDDPFSLVYFAVTYLPAEITSGPLGSYTTIVGYRFNDPINTSTQKSFNATFAPVMAGLNVTSQQQLTVPIAKASLLTDPYFPYGFRRGFWGTQTSKVTPDFIRSMAQCFKDYIADILSRGENPYSASWVLQYMPPGLNGNLPSSDEATAWPHAVSGHQTLFAPAWNSSRDDVAAHNANMMLSDMTYAHQATLDPPFLADYPNYMSPSIPAHRIYGDNVNRLIEVKDKYDPWCRLHQGRVFATLACEIGGWANLFSTK